MALKDRAFHRPLVVRLGQKCQKYVLQRGQRLVYPVVTRRLTRRLAADGLATAPLLMNFGYEEDPPMELPLAVSDEPSRYGIQLYHRTATQVDLSGKRVLEVGCGHGGGASYLFRTLQLASYTGLDLNQAGIAFCRKTHNLPGLDFVHGDAENLPFPNQSFDAVVNIESSQLYPRFPRFLAQVARVLRPGGHFLYADSQSPDGVAAWEAALADAPMRMISQRVINAEVLRAMEQNSQREQDLIDRYYPPLLRGFVRNIASTQGPVSAALRSGELSYRIYCFARAESQ